MVGAVTLGLTSPLAIGAGGAVLAGGVGAAGLRRSTDALCAELDVSPTAAQRLYRATGTWGLKRWRRPRTDAEMRDFGRAIIAAARASG